MKLKQWSKSPVEKMLNRMNASGSLPGSGGHAVTHYGGIDLVRLHYSVTHPDNPVCMQGDVVFVRDQDNGIPLVMNPFKNPHDFIAGF